MGSSNRMQMTLAEEISAPPWWMALAEVPRSVFELAAVPLATPVLSTALRGDGHPVLVVPGFSAGDASTAVLRTYLGWLGYSVYGWDLGRNMGWRVAGRGAEALSARLHAIREASGEKVSIVGWSLGGIMARQQARQHPGDVRQVVSIGAPFTGNPHASSISGLYEQLSGETVDGAFMRSVMAESRKCPPVRATAIYSRSDGIVAWENCIEVETGLAENIEVVASHCGMMFNPAVLYALADRLALPEEGWEPFDRSGWRSIVYPPPVARATGPISRTNARDRRSTPIS